jgi:hypothetical protein
MYEDNASHHKVRKTPCLVCQDRVVDVAHIKSRGSGGTDDEWNLMPLCRKHHTEQHTIGIISFIQKYLTVSIYLSDQGWFLYNGKLVNERFITREKLPPELGEN